MVKTRLKELDSLRGIAALLVVFYHFTAGLPVFYSFTKLGGTAVDLFFMISGFVIFLTIKEAPSWHFFIKKRFLRLYPAYWICLIITTVTIFINNHYLNIIDNGLPWRFLANFTMLQNYMRVDDIDGPYWTLAIELMFYVFMAFLLIIKSLHKIEIIGYGILVLMAFLQWCILPFHPILYHGINRIFLLINHWPLFFAGILFYKQMVERETLFRYFGIALCLIFAIIVFKQASRLTDFTTTAEYTSVVIVYFVVFFLLTKNKLTALKVKPLLFLGYISYTLYLIHQYVGRDFLLTMLLHFTNINFWLGCFIVITLCIILSAFITGYLEVRLRAVLNKYLFPVSNKPLVVKKVNSFNKSL